MKKKMAKVLVGVATVTAGVVVLGLAMNKVFEWEEKKYDEDEDYDCGCADEEDEEYPYDEYEAQCQEVCWLRQFQTEDKQ